MRNKVTNTKHLVGIWNLSLYVINNSTMKGGFEKLGSASNSNSDSDFNSIRRNREEYISDHSTSLSIISQQDTGTYTSFPRINTCQHLDVQLMESETSEEAEAEADGIMILPSNDDISNSSISSPHLTLVASSVEEPKSLNGFLSLRFSAICSSISSVFSERSTGESSPGYSEIANIENISEHLDGDLLVISTDNVRSRYVEQTSRETLPDLNSITSDLDSNADTDTISSKNTIASATLLSSPQQVQSCANNHDFSAMTLETVGIALLGDTKSVNTIKNVNEGASKDNTTRNEWFDFTDTQWDWFVTEASKILPLLDPSIGFNGVFLKAPPSPPNIHKKVLNAQSDQVLESKDFLPPEFICSLCQLPIVGSTTLDCGCNKSFCISCIEQMFDDKSVVREKFEHESRSSSRESVTCPFCLSSCSHTPCHVLDVAMLKLVMELRPIDDVLGKKSEDVENNIRDFQTKFYARLLLWRQEVHRRQAENDRHRQLLLSNYAQYEKETLRLCKTIKERKRWYQSEGFFLISSIVGYLGTRAFLRR